MGLILAVGIGGFFGAIARYVLVNWVTGIVTFSANPNIPVGTLFVNVTGSFLLAVFLGLVQRHDGLPEAMRLLIATGFFGAYTTFSTFANEGLGLMLEGDWRGAFLYIGMTNILCLLGAALGLLLVGRFSPAG